MTVAVESGSTARSSGRRLPVSSPVAAVGLLSAVVLAVACFLPWSSYAGFPGKMTLAYPGGSRLYVLLLCLPAVLFLLPRAGGRSRALHASALGALLVTLANYLFIGYAGGGLVNVAPGIYLALVAAVVQLLASYGLRVPTSLERPPSRPYELRAGRWTVPVELVLTVLLVAVALLVFVVGLGLNTANVATGKDHVFRDVISLNEVTNESEFISFVVAVAALAACLSRCGVTAALGAMTQRHRPVLITAALLAATVFPFTQDGKGYALRIAASIGVFAVAAIGLNVVVGLAGLLDLGYIAFFGVGAYVAALVSGTTSSVFHVHLPFALVIVLGAAVSGLFGLVLGAPTLRLRGDYLAIVTLGFGEIFRITVNNLDGQSGPSLTNGPNGVSNIPDLAFGSFSFGDDHTLFGIQLPFQANYYWLEVVLLVVVMAAFLRLAKSRIGRAWVAIREDELAAAATGINTTRLKLLAFGIGATLAGAAGTVDAHVVKVASPDSFDFTQSALLLAAVILGGMGTVPGALVGSTVLILLPEKLRFLSDLRLLVFGIALVLVMRLRPQGLISNARRSAELHELDGYDGRSGSLDPPPGTGDVVVL